MLTENFNFFINLYLMLVHVISFIFSFVILKAFQRYHRPIHLQHKTNIVLFLDCSKRINIRSFFFKVKIIIQKQPSYLFRSRTDHCPKYVLSQERSTLLKAYDCINISELVISKQLSYNPRNKKKQHRYSGNRVLLLIL